MPGESSMSTESKPADSQSVVDDLMHGLRETADNIVPWFIEQMPQMYFQDTSYDTQLSHLRAIIAAKASGRPIELTLRNEDGTEWTAMRPLDYPGVLAEIVRELPLDRPLLAAKIHTANDGQLVLDTFEFGDAPMFEPDDPTQGEKLDQTIAYAAQHQPDFSPQEIVDHLHRCRAMYVQTVTPLRICKNWQLYKRVSGTDGSAISLEPESDPTQCRITVAVGNATQRVMFERIASRLAHSSINIHRAYLDVIDDSPNGSIGCSASSCRGRTVGRSIPRASCGKHCAPICFATSGWMTARLIWRIAMLNLMRFMRRSSPACAISFTRCW
jgi:glutamate dehydrogenase